MLKTEKVTLLKVKYGELDRWLSEQLGYEYSCVAVEEWNNYEEHEWTVDGELDKWDARKVLKALGGNIPMYSLRPLLNYFCREGKLEAGTYLVEVFW
jgi:hypothetical protein